MTPSKSDQIKLTPEEMAEKYCELENLPFNKLEDNENRGDYFDAYLAGYRECESRVEGKQMTSKKEKQAPADRVWMRKSDGQLGCCIVGSWLGNCWFYGEWPEHKIVNKDTPWFIVPDPREHRLTADDFEDLGEL